MTLVLKIIRNFINSQQAPLLLSLNNLVQEYVKTSRCTKRVMYRFYSYYITRDSP